MSHLLINLLFTSGPIREKLWIGHLALVATFVLSVVLTIWLSTPGAVERTNWAFPVRGRWLHHLLEGALFICGGVFLLLLATNGMGFFLFFPWLVK